MKPSSTKTRRQKVEEKEGAIIDATRRIFRERGANDTRISEIARRANVAEGTVYLYFENKKSLLLAAVTDFYAELTHDAELVVENASDTRTRLTQLAKLHFQRVMEEWAMISEAMSPFLSASDYRSSKAYQLNRRYVAIFDRVMRDGMAADNIRSDIDIPVLRNAFYGGLEHCARTARLRPTQTDVEREVDAFMAIFAAGIMQTKQLAITPIDDPLERLRNAVDEVERLVKSTQGPKL